MIEGFKIQETYARRDRLYVRLVNDEGRQISMPKANYVWLKHNPAFESIPKGYVIHHLDHDKTNDDPSNLVIMQKHQHSAHHWKSKIINPDVKFDDLREYWPTTEPRIYRDKKCKSPSYYIAFREKDKDGYSSIIRRIQTYGENKMRTIEDAEQVKWEIWGQFQESQQEFSTSDFSNL